MTPTAKSFSAPCRPEGKAADPFAAFWLEPVPPLRPLGSARVIHSWEAPSDLWRAEDEDGPEAGRAAEPDRASGSRLS